MDRSLLWLPGLIFHLAVLTASAATAPQLSEQEVSFRARMEQRKEALLSSAQEVRHPVLLPADSRERARLHLEQSAWARDLVKGWEAKADYVLSQPAGYVATMISELTPLYSLGLTCPNCVGVKSQEADGRLAEWDYRTPDRFTCRYCGHAYPSERYAETAVLEAPRMGQRFTFYLSADQLKSRELPDDPHAYRWHNRPVYMSFSGIIRGARAEFMAAAARDLAYGYHLTGKVRYAQKAREILLRFASAYRNWLYFDYYGTLADADPLYAAWHDRQLRPEWKRHFSASAYAGDTAEQAAMQRDFWGAGRLGPSTDHLSSLVDLAQAFDVLAAARDENGAPILSAGERTTITRDLFLEAIFTAEYYIRLENARERAKNKAPRIYSTFAAVGRVLGIPELMDAALQGYEEVIRTAFTYDGMTTQSPSYSNMFLSGLKDVPEFLEGAVLPERFGRGTAPLDLYAGGNLQLLYQAMLDQLRSGGQFLPLEDTGHGSGPSAEVLEVGLRRFPDLFAGRVDLLSGRGAPGAYALFNLTPEAVAGKVNLPSPEIYYPQWKTAILRHGSGANASVLSLNFSDGGSGHRQRDNLSVYYDVGGRALLGDHGYVGDSPVNDWIRSSLSHNLVVVDEQNQAYERAYDRQAQDAQPRRPRLHLMATGPLFSVVEASSNAYPQTSDYRRLLLLLKGPESQHMAVDLFRVSGGSHHAFRLFSDFAASDAQGGGTLVFDGIEMPGEAPLPQVGPSLKREDIFGVRDARRARNAPAEWRATWSEAAGGYRFWNLAAADAVIAYNGPGQEGRGQGGRRVRYLDVVRRGQDLRSCFVGVHEPVTGDREGVVRTRRIPVPQGAGPDAVGLEIVTTWGRYVILNEFEREAQAAGLRFQGKLGIFFEDEGGARGWLCGIGSGTLQATQAGFSGLSPEWTGSAAADSRTLRPGQKRPSDWEDPPAGFQSYVLVHDGRFHTGFPVRRADVDAIETERFPLPSTLGPQFTLPSVRFREF